MKALRIVLSSAALLLVASCGSQDSASSLPPKPQPSAAGTLAAATPPAEKNEPKEEGKSEPKKDDGKKEDAKNTVTIDNFSFSPQELTVPVNTTVTWINHDDIPHTVKDTQKHFKSPTLDTDEKYSFTFTEPGTYDYFCTIHAHMTGKIIVK